MSEDSTGSTSTSHSARPENDLSCKYCERRFARREHLSRHIRSHLNQRPFQCGKCGNTFLRADTLKRHEALNCSTDLRPKVHRRHGRVPSACHACAKAKLRCSTGSPCARCIEKRIICSKANHKAEERQKVLEDHRQNKDGSTDLSPCPPSPLSHHQECPSASRVDSQGTIPVGVANLLQEPLLGADCNFTVFQCENLKEDLWKLTASDGQQQGLQLQEDYDLENMYHSTDCLANIDNMFVWRPSLDYFDLSAFPPITSFETENAPIVFSSVENRTTSERSDPGLTTTRSSLVSTGSSDGQLGHDTHVDSWYSYSRPGLIQTPLWQRTPPYSPRISTRTYSSRKKNAPSTLDRGCGDIIELFDIKDILAMDDHGHVPRLASEKLQELWAFIDHYHCKPPVTSRIDNIKELQNPDIVNSFLQLYFEHFDPILPLVHKASFNLLQTSPLLVLAIATIGSRFSRIKHAREITTGLSDILGRAIDAVLQEDTVQTLQVSFAQAAVLNQIHMAYCGSSNLALKAQFQRNMLVIRESLKQANYCDHKLRQWLDEELGRRVIYSIWLVDCQFSLHCGVPPIMNLEDLEPYLPCHESIWELDISELSARLTTSQGEFSAAIEVHARLTVPEIT
ncbi:fungal-specific transcription factor domain-containing protein [Xylogone sp. PMI_703]|nr:fungal-specific transcription factor domain-containing protein [Xylogone sp. PMI_703]